MDVALNEAKFRLCIEKKGEEQAYQENEFGRKWYALDCCTPTSNASVDGDCCGSMFGPPSFRNSIDLCSCSRLEGTKVATKFITV